MLSKVNQAKRTENDFVQAILDKSGDVIDIADITGKTPFDELMEKEEREALDSREENREAQVEAISALLAYILKDKDPLQICIRIFLLAYVINPQLVDGMSLAMIGRHLGGISKQRLSTKLKQQDKAIGYRGRNRKTETQKQTYSEVQKEVWKKRKTVSIKEKTKSKKV